MNRQASKVLGIFDSSSFFHTRSPTFIIIFLKMLPKDSRAWRGKESDHAKLGLIYANDIPPISHAMAPMVVQGPERKDPSKLGRHS